MKSLILAWIALIATPAGWSENEPRSTAGTPAESGPAFDMTAVGVRKASKAFLISRKARIPLLATIYDRRGLKSLTYVIRIARLDSSGKPGVEEEQRVAVEGFAEFNRWRAMAYRGITRARSMLGLQTSPLQPPQKFCITPADRLSCLDLTRLTRALPSSGPDMPPPRLRMRLWLEAATVSAASGLVVGQSESCIFVVVPEIDLLLEVAKEEELLELRWEDKVTERLQQTYGRLLKLSDQLAYARSEDLPYLRSRAADARASIELAREFAQEIISDYRQIVGELRFNRVRPEMIERIEKTIIAPMENAVSQGLVKYHKSLEGFLNVLADDDPMPARKSLEKLLAKTTAQLNDLRIPAKAMRELGAKNEDYRLHRMIEELIGDRD
jgi:hypothetical protein